MPRRGRLSLGGGKGELNLATGEPLVDRGSVFQAQIMWPIKSEAEAEAALATMKQQSACAGADHNMAGKPERGRGGTPAPDCLLLSRDQRPCALSLALRTFSASPLPSAYRFVRPDKKISKRYDDDGEKNGGQRLLGTRRAAPALRPRCVRPAPSGAGKRPRFGSRVSPASTGCLTKQKAVGVAAVVSRVWGGQNLGKARFEHIVSTAAQLLVSARS